MRYHEVIWTGFLIILIIAVILTVLPSRLGYQGINPIIGSLLIMTTIIIVNIGFGIWVWRHFLKEKE